MKPSRDDVDCSRERKRREGPAVAVRGDAMGLLTPWTLADLARFDLDQGTR